MNISDLEANCKIRAREVFENFKPSLSNHPFVNTEINQGIIDDCIEFEVNQVYGRKILKKYIDQAKSEEQRKYLDKRIEYYKEILIKTACSYGYNKLPKS